MVSEGCHKSVLSVLPRVPTRESTAEGTEDPASVPAAFASHCLLTTSHLEAGNVVQSIGQEGSRTPGPWAEVRSAEHKQASEDQGKRLTNTELGPRAPDIAWG